ncbi:MAG: CDP-alcohol phosphatidyltransferase family protein [Rhabdochlamydiaceae bacterium]|nr:CDP-alcohol phosphatidyltransferase family protein [Rhabdochlamydiaceae bacterium]
MLSLSNSLSFLRAPLAFLFLVESSTCRVTAILLAMLTDCIDGYLARRRRAVTQFGAILDPAMDKFFVFFALTVLLVENRLDTWQALAMISRDFFLCVFGLYLCFAGHWRSYTFKAIRWGKATTALQFLVLIGLTLGYRSPWYLYCTFILFGLLAFIELTLELSQYKRTSASRAPKEP